MSVLTLDSLVKIENNYVSYGGNKYFRRNAHRMELCSHGRKKASAISVNYMSISAKGHYAGIRRPDEVCGHVSPHDQIAGYFCRVSAIAVYHKEFFYPHEIFIRQVSDVVAVGFSDPVTLRHHRACTAANNWSFD